MKIYEFRISLMEVEPEIWRRVRIRADSSFWYLHCALQDAMGWLNGHLHCFRIPARSPDGFIEIGIPDPEGYDSVEILPGWNVRIDEYFNKEGDRADYDYDFGDGWEHDLVLERILEVEDGTEYPSCTDGARSCPPEDCGGPLGYERLLEIVSDTDHEEHESMMEWLGGEFDPEAFSVDEVYYLDPECELSAVLAEYDEDHPAAVVTLPAPAAGSSDDRKDIGDILEKLAYYRGEFQKEALEAAIERREEITPLLLEALEEFVASPEVYVEDEDRVLHLNVLLLLAQFRETRAFPLVMDICRFSGEYLDKLLGDYMTEYLDRIIASVFNGDLERIKSVVEDASLHEYARASALSSLQMLVHMGVLSRFEVIEYYVRLFRGGLEEEYSFVWDELANEVVDLHAVELADDIQEKFEAGFLDPTYMTPMDAKMELAMPEEEAMIKARRLCRGPIDDTVSILEGWLDPNVEFTRHPELEELLESSDEYYRDGRILKRVDPKVGRNDPCPCGSGKKYKKCCGK